MVHHIKILTCYFEAVLDGRKRFEIRFNDDRGFNAGDAVVMHEIDKIGETGNIASAEITYVTNYQQKEGYVVFGFKLDGEA
jgi:hypothetical protein